MVEDKKARKISRESFGDKHKKLKNKHKLVYSQIKEKYNVAKSKENDKDKLSTLKKIFHKDLRLEKNRYALTYNALKNEKLYRKGVLETKISALRQNYNRSKYKAKFNKISEKEKLDLKIKKLTNDYSLPVSTKLRKSRITKSDEQMKFIKVPIATPFRANIRIVWMLLLAGVLSTVALDVFIKPFGIYNAGLRGITQALYYIMVKFNEDTPTWMSYLLFIGFNVPLAIFGYFKVGKKFTILTIAFLLVQYFISTILDFSDLRNQIKPFGKTASEISHMIRNGAKNDIYQYVIPILSAFLGGILYGISVGIVYKAGASTGGSKFVVTYLSIKKDKSVGKLAIYLSIFVIIFGLVINHIILGGEQAITAFTSMTLFATIIFVFSSNTMIDRIFARSRKEQISVVTNKKNIILRFLDAKYLYNRSFTSTKVRTSFDKNLKTQLSFTVSAGESKLLLKIFSQLDPNALITSIAIDKTAGRFYSSWFE